MSGDNSPNEDITYEQLLVERDSLKYEFQRVVAILNETIARLHRDMEAAEVAAVEQQNTIDHLIAGTRPTAMLNLRQGLSRGDHITVTTAARAACREVAELTRTLSESR